jgi:hypothetical protein
MMKRIFSAALLCAVALSLAAPAFSARMVTEPLIFRTHKVTAGTGETLKNDLGITWGTTCNACAVDSLVMNRLGSAAASWPLTQVDTTLAISTANWYIPPTSGAADSSFVARLTLYAGSAQHGTGDSVYIAIQVSPNGMNWNYVNPVKDVAGSNPITAASWAVTGFALLESGGDGGVYSLKIQKGGDLSGSLPDRLNWWQYPLVRFIVSGEHAATYISLAGSLTHMED